MKVHRGSFTIEAAIWIPFILGLMFSVLHQGIFFYKESVHREISDENKTWDAVSTFYEIQILKEIGEERKNE